MVNVILTQQGDIRNIGEYALLRSEVDFLNEIFDELQISVLTFYPERLRRMEPTLESYSPLIDLKIRGKDRSFLLLLPFVLFFQTMLTCISLAMLKVNLKPIYRPKVLEKFKHADIVIAGGTQAFNEGSLLQRRQSIAARATNLFVLFWGVYEVFITKKILRKPFITFPQSIGPFRSWIGKRGIQYILCNADAVLLREDYTLRLLEGIKKKAAIHIAADMAFLFKESAKTSRDLPRPVIGVSPCFPHSFSQKQQEDYVKAHAKALDYMVGKYAVSIVFMPSVVGQGETEKREKARDDLEVCRMIFQNMVHQNKSEMICAATPDEFVSLVEQLDMLIPTRMHPSILAATKHVPFVAIIYEHKQKGLLKKLGVESLAMDVNEVTFEKLRSRVEYVWNERTRIRHSLSLKVPMVQRQTATLVKQVISVYLSATKQ